MHFLITIVCRCAWSQGCQDPGASTLGTRAGFSFTHAVPMCDGRALQGAVRRINVGGKALTNYFKELVSYRCASSSACVEFNRPYLCCHCPMGLG